MASRPKLGLDTVRQLCETSYVCDLNCVCAAGFQMVASVPGSAPVSVKLLSHVQKNATPQRPTHSWTKRRWSGVHSLTPAPPHRLHQDLGLISLLFLCRVCARLCGFFFFSSSSSSFFSYAFLPHSKSSVRVRQRGDSKLPVGMNVSVSACLPICVQPCGGLATCPLSCHPPLCMLVVERL